MKKFLLLCAIIVQQLFSCQLKADSIVMFTSKTNTINSSFDNYCFRTGESNPKYKAGSLLFLTDVQQCTSFSKTKNIVGFYFDGKKYYMEDNDEAKNTFILGGKRKNFLDLKTRFDSYSISEKDSIQRWAQIYSELSLINAKKEAYEKVFSKEKNGIAIISAYPTEGYAFTGADFKILNFSKKTIKYITFNFFGKNPVDDRVGANVSRKGIGPVESLGTGKWSFDNVWLTDVIETLKLLSVNIIYMDGTAKTIPITDKYWLDQEDLDNFNDIMD